MTDKAAADFRRAIIQAGADVSQVAERLGMMPTKCLETLTSFITEDPAMKEMKTLVKYLHVLDDPVLIVGESGTGKEIIARALHGDRAGSFVGVNCAALNKELFESELFGHVSGAFTGSAGNKEGLMETAKNGTLFLDEIGEMDLAIQAKLLRAIQEKQIRRVGDTVFRPVNCRIVCATHRNIRSVTMGSECFREDLYWRLCVYEVRLTPLRERRGDIHEILDARLDKDHMLSPEEVSALETMELKGNYRELEFHVKRALLRKKLGLKVYEL